ncbi:MAG: GSCFA domain-containing protein [Bacteroidetes bacterium]|nr:GSCFA domain-containing protein [Bacteroidota bacterium]
MNFQLGIEIPQLEPQIQHHHKIILSGSCFTEHMTGFMQRAKFQVMQNAHGIIFNPLSVCKSLLDVAEAKLYTADDLFFLNEYWHSWYHHSDFSDMNQQICLEKINQSIASQHAFLKQADYIIITLGSAFAYQHIEQSIFVSNNHRAPAVWFSKVLLDINEIKSALQNMQQKLISLHPQLKFIYTISPVRHVRDGVIENNRSKARLLEAVHAMPNSYYFPAYELVIDILRDYRFYDIDMVHPNYQATAFVWEKFLESCVNPSCFPLLKKLDQVFKAKNHRPKSTSSLAHQKFTREHHNLCLQLQGEYPYLDLLDEINTFAE